MRTPSSRRTGDDVLDRRVVGRREQKPMPTSSRQRRHGVAGRGRCGRRAPRARRRCRSATRRRGCRAWPPATPAPATTKAAVGRDVEGAGAVAAGAAGVDATAPDGGADRLGAGAHGARRARDLLGRLALRAQRDQEARDLGRRRPRPSMIAVAGLGGLGAAEVLAGQQPVDGVARSPRLASRAAPTPTGRGSSRAAPCPRRSGSTRGGTARPRPAASRWRTPMISPSSVQAVTSRSAGRARLDHQRVVAGRLERGRRAPRTRRAPSWWIARGLAVHRAARRARPGRRTPAPIAWWPRQTPRIGIRPAELADRRRREMPASSGCPGRARSRGGSGRARRRSADGDRVVADAPRPRRPARPGTAPGCR